MKATEIYGSAFLNVAVAKQNWLLDKPLKVKSVELQNIREKDKLVIYAEDVDQGLPLNKTNAGIIIKKWGEETNAWIGKTFRLIVVPKTFQGQTVDGLMVIAD